MYAYQQNKPAKGTTNLLLIKLLILLEMCYFSTRTHKLSHKLIKVRYLIRQEILSFKILASLVILREIIKKFT